MFKFTRVRRVAVLAIIMVLSVTMMPQALAASKNTSVAEEIRNDPAIREIVDGPIVNGKQQHVLRAKGGKVYLVKGKRSITPLVYRGVKDLKYNSKSKTCTIWVKNSYEMAESRFPSWLKIAMKFDGHVVKVKGKYVYINGTQAVKVSTWYPKIYCFHETNGRRILAIDAVSGKILEEDGEMPFKVYISPEGAKKE